MERLSFNTVTGIIGGAKINKINLVGIFFFFKFREFMVGGQVN